ncbi:MAG: DNA-binding protein [Pseudomonadota bacterium]
MTLDNLVGRGLEKADTDKGEISRYLAKIRRKLEDSKKSSISLDSRFDIAFEALLQIALAAIRVNGYRTTTGAGHQQLAIQLLPKSLGIESGEIRALDEYRKKRSIGLYEADFDPSESEVKAVIRSVEKLLEKLTGHIRTARPELLDRPR